jgi:hypothetical protein
MWKVQVSIHSVPKCLRNHLLQCWDQKRQLVTPQVMMHCSWPSAGRGELQPGLESQSAGPMAGDVQGLDPGSHNLRAADAHTAQGGVSSPF